MRRETGLLGLMALILIPTGCDRGNQKPNIIYIYADDMGIGDIGCYGQKHIHTPNIDRMAAEGMLFTNHYSGSAVSSPSRSCLITGQHSGHTYVRGNYEVASPNVLEEGQLPLRADETTLPAEMKKVGYATGAFGKWGIGSSASYGNPNAQGFDTFYGYVDQRHAHNHYPTYLIKDTAIVRLNNPDIPRNEMIEPTDDPSVFERYKGNEYSLDLMVDEAKSFIREHRDVPFFVYLPVIVPHRALQVPDEELEQYDFEETPYWGENKFLPHPRPRAAYAGMLSRLDRKVGEVLSLLDELGLAENTLVMFSSDNGPCNIGGGDTDFFNSAMGLCGGKRSLHEGGIRAPLVARWPGHIKPGSRSDILSAQYDMMATFMDMAGAEAPSSSDGISILPTLLGKRQKHVHDHLYFEYVESGGQQAVRVGRFKAYRDLLKKDPTKAWSLYDLDVDPHEDSDVASQYPDIVAQVDKISLAEHTQPIVAAWCFTAEGKSLPFDANSPEGSLEGLERLCDEGRDELLARVFLTSDDRIVLAVSDDLATISDGRGKIGDHSLKELKSLRLRGIDGSVTESQIPAVEEALVWSRGRHLLTFLASDPLTARIAHLADMYKCEIIIK